MSDKDRKQGSQSDNKYFKNNFNKDTNSAAKKEVVYFVKKNNNDGEEKEVKEINEKDHKKSHHKDEEEEVAPKHSKLRDEIFDLYDWFMSGDRTVRDTEGEVARLKAWIEDYSNNTKGGKSDIKFNMKPIVVRDTAVSVNLKYQKNWRQYPEKWQMFLEALDKLQIHPVAILGIFQAIEEFKIYLEKDKTELAELLQRLRTVGSKGWWGISIEYIEKYVLVFNVGELTSKEDVNRVCGEIDRLLSRQNPKHAAIMILAFNMMKYYDGKSIIKQLLGLDLVDEAVRFVGNDEQLARFFLLNINPNKHASKGREVIKKFNFDPYDFKGIVRAQSFLAIRSLVKRLNWMLAEDILQLDTRAELGQLVDVLVREKMLNEALSVAQRNQLDLSRDVTKASELTLTSTRGLTPAPNTLLTKDEFGPTEVYLEGKDLDSYLTLATFGIKESDVKFINKEGPLFDEVTSKILESNRVGVDAEFRGDLIGYSDSKIAILQIASNQIVAIFDFIALEGSEKLYDFCVKLFSSPDIEKLGHTFTSDIKCLRSSFKGKPLDFANVINIDQVFTEGTTKFGLAAIVKKVFNKEFSKYNQQSNWRRRPLRRSQIHYAALDAVATMKCFENIEKTKDPRVETVQHENYSSSQSESPSKKGDKKGAVVQNEQLLNEYREKKHYKFIIDATTKKLATNLRNIGLDAAWVDEKMKPNEICKMAEQEERIILTRDNKLLTCKKTQPLVKIISNNPYSQLQQIIKLLDIKVTKDKLLSRCVKCNDKSLKLIPFEEAQKTLKWENAQDSNIKEYWQCGSCNQIYWEGGTFDRAKKMFSQLISSTNTLEKQPSEILEDKSDDDEESSDSIEHIRQKQFKTEEKIGAEGVDLSPAHPNSQPIDNELSADHLGKAPSEDMMEEKP